MLALTRRLRSDDAGFTLVELMVAATVILTALSLMAGVLTSGLTATGYARERQSATQLANRTLEQVRALAFDTMRVGLSTGDATLAGDASITSCSGASCYRGETLATHAPDASNDSAPLVPHRSTTTIGPNAYTISSYVTYYQNNLATEARRVTVDVSWTSPLKGNSTHNVQAQTIIVKPSTKLCPNTTCKYPGPSQAFFTSSAAQEAASVNISGSIGLNNALGLDRATLYSGRAASDITIEQLTTSEGLSQTAGATIQALSGAPLTIGRDVKTSFAGNDPGGAASVWNSQDLTTPVAANQSLTAGGNTLTVSATAGGAGRTTSTTSACTTSCAAPATPSPRNCPNLTGYTNDTDAQPCGGSSSTTGATVTASANLPGIGSLALAALGPQVNPTVTTTDRKTAAGGTTCPTTTGDGCVRAQASRTAFDLSAGALPSNLNVLLKPLGFTYFAQITGVTDSVVSESGVGSVAPTATQTGGTVRVYCASAILGDLLCPLTGYVTKTLSQITSAVTTPTLTIFDPLLGGGTTIGLSATITPGSTTSSSNCSGTCTRTQSTSVSTPPKVTITETINNVLSLTLVLDPGALTAKTTYVQAT